MRTHGGGEGTGDSVRPSNAGNQLSGAVQGPVVQARDIVGDVHLTYQRPVPDVPRQVPPCVAQFVNRVKELDAVDRWLTAEAPSATGLVVLSGLPGVGKSMTARRWSQRASSRFPAGELYVDFAALREQVGGDVSEGLAGCLRALGVASEAMPATLAERANLFRTKTAAGPVLVVLDDVTEPAQVAPFVPRAPGSAVLVTSNRRLAELSMDGAWLLPLEPLDADSGRQLLAALCGEQRVGAEPEAAARLVAWCGGLPVALRVVAGRLRTRRRLTLDRLLTDVAGRGEPKVSAVFSVAYRDLSAVAARLYRRLGLLPGRDVDLTVAAVAADLDPPTAEDALETLIETHLLDEASVDGRYRFHDLVRQHAAGCALAEESEADRDAVLGRVVDHYTRWAAYADLIVMRSDRLRIADHTVVLRGCQDPFAGERERALTWLRTERAELLAVLRAAVASGRDRQAWWLAEAMTALYLNERYLADWTETCELGAAAAARDGAPEAEARLRTLLTRPLLDTGQLERARTELERAVALTEGSTHLVLRASIQEFFGRYWDQVDPARAVTAYQTAFGFVEGRHQRAAALALYFLGCSQDASGQRETALATLTDAHARLVGLEDQRMAARARASLGRVHGQLGDLPQAVRELTAAVAELRAVGASAYEAQGLESLADLARRQGDPAAERRHLDLALTIHQRAGGPRAEELRARLTESEETQADE